MSGLEIAGMAIAALQICGQTLSKMDNTMTIVKRFWDWRYKIPSYVAQLNGQRLDLLLSLQLLYSSVDEELDVDKVDPRTDMTAFQKQRSRELVAKLQSKYGETYYRSIDSDICSLCRHVGRLYHKLGLGTLSETAFLREAVAIQPADQSLLREFQSRLIFSISRAVIQSLLEAIRQTQHSIDSKLNKLTKLNKARELRRSCLEQPKMQQLRKLRSQAVMLHSAMINGLSCSLHAHDVMLRLEPRLLSLDRDKAGKRPVGVDAYGLCVGSIPSEPYRFVEVQMVGSEVMVTRSADQRSSSSQVEDLCSVIRQGRIGDHPRLCFRLDANHGATLHNHDDIPSTPSVESNEKVFIDSSRFVSLGNVLMRSTESVGSLGKFSERQRRYLAVLLSLNALHLLATPWLKSVWGKNDIQFIGPDVSGGCTAEDFEFAFINHRFETEFNRTSSVANLENNHPNNVSQKTRIGLLMLAAILLELSLAQPLEMDQDVTVSGQYWMSEYLPILLGLQKQLEERKDDLSMAYQDALISCLGSAFDSRIDFDKDDWLDVAFGKIVVPLRNEYLAFTGGAGIIA